MQAWEDGFIVAINSSYHNSRTADMHDSLAPRLTIAHDTTAHRLLDFSNHELVGWARGQGVPFNGMQMTRTALWVVWDVALLAHAVVKREARAVGERHTDPAPGESSGFCTHVVLSGNAPATVADIGGDEAVSGIGSVYFVEFTPGL